MHKNVADMMNPLSFTQTPIEKKKNNKGAFHESTKDLIIVSKVDTWQC